MLREVFGVGATSIEVERAVICPRFAASGSTRFEMVREEIDVCVGDLVRLGVLVVGNELDQFAVSEDPLSRVAPHPHDCASRSAVDNLCLACISADLQRPDTSVSSDQRRA
jgi:hypothetical protein